MLDEQDRPDPSHGMKKVKLYLISNDTELKKIKLKEKKGLKDVAPTILKIMEIEKPKEMDGQPIF